MMNEPKLSRAGRSQMPRFSIVIPFYDGLDNIYECVGSIFNQGVNEVEAIIVDDRDKRCSGDGLEGLFEFEPRVRILHRQTNGGTLRARRDGVLASNGDIVLLLDQDDALSDGCLLGIAREFVSCPVDILHFGAKVLAETDRANDAAAGMESFLTPPVRLLQGDEILVRQFAFEDGFDWHVHHKAYRGEFARGCWSKAADVRLTLSDDLYLSFILASEAKSYRAVDEHWYLYHLGRGETLGGSYSLESLRRVSELDAKALKLLREFVARPDEVHSRSDWEERLGDVRDHLIEHVANEMADNLPLESRDEAIKIVCEAWSPNDFAGELWRFARDRAYGLYDSGVYPKKHDELYVLTDQAQSLDVRVNGEGTLRYQQMKSAALRHLNDLETIAPPAHKLVHRIGRLFG